MKKHTYFFSKYGKLWSTNTWDYMAFYLLSRSRSLPACSHGGHRTQVNPLCHMFRSEPDLKGTSKILWFLSLKRGMKNADFAWGFKVLRRYRSFSAISSEENALHINGKTFQSAKNSLHSFKIKWTLVHKRLRLRMFTNSGRPWKHNTPLCCLVFFSKIQRTKWV